MELFLIIVFKKMLPVEQYLLCYHWSSIANAKVLTTWIMYNMRELSMATRQKQTAINLFVGMSTLRPRVSKATGYMM